MSNVIINIFSVFIFTVHVIIRMVIIIIITTIIIAAIIITIMSNWLSWKEKIYLA